MNNKIDQSEKATTKSIDCHDGDDDCDDRDHEHEHEHEHEHGDHFGIIQDACDKLWDCNHGEQIYIQLQHIHQQLLAPPQKRKTTRTFDDHDYDPSEAFLSIQGASLRFLPIDQKKKMKTTTMKMTTTTKSEKIVVQEQIEQKTSNDDRNDDKNKKKINATTNPQMITPTNATTKKENKTSLSSSSPSSNSSPLSLSSSQANTSMNQIDEELDSLHWAITIEALQTAATLACVCVGPSWRSQLRTRRRDIASHHNRQHQQQQEQQQQQQQQKKNKSNTNNNHHINTPKSINETADAFISSLVSVGMGRRENAIESSDRSFSPETTSTITMSTGIVVPGSSRTNVGGGDGDGAIVNDEENNTDNVSYPPIPEVLPAAMLRFARSAHSRLPDIQQYDNDGTNDNDIWSIRRKKIAIGQQRLTVGLCCESRLPKNEALYNQNSNNAMMLDMVEEGVINNINNNKNSRDIDNLIPGVGRRIETLPWSIPGANELVGDMLLYWYSINAIFPENVDNHNDNDDPNRQVITRTTTTTTSEIDWSYILGITRVSTDLISAGWTPLPITNIDEIITCYLLRIARHGVTLLLDYTQDAYLKVMTMNDTKKKQQQGIHERTKKRSSFLDQTKTVEERIATSSSAAEAISSLASLGTRGLIPSKLQKSTTQTVAWVHIVSSMIKKYISTLLTVSKETGEGMMDETSNIMDVTGSSNSIRYSSRGMMTTSELQTCLAQVESCHADTTDTLWILLGTPSSSENTYSELIKMIQFLYQKNSESFDGISVDTNERDDDTNNASTTRDQGQKQLNNVYDRLACQKAGTAFRIIGAALWDKPLGADIETSHLRLYMHDFLQTIRAASASLHSTIQHHLFDTEEGEGRIENEAASSPLTTVTATATCVDLLSLALDAVVALGYFTNRQLHGGSNDILSCVEWETFLDTLKDCFSPWVIYCESNIVKGIKSIRRVLERAYLEVQSLLLRVGAFLDRFVRIDDSPFHSIVEYEQQKLLYRFILRNVVPYIESTDAELLGLSVTRAWIKFGLFPFRGGDWDVTAEEILWEVFSTYDDDGAFVHSTQVRLEALRSLTPDDKRQMDNHGQGNPPTLSSREQMLSIVLQLGDRPMVNHTLVPLLCLILNERNHLDNFGLVTRQRFISSPKGRLGSENDVPNQIVIPNRVTFPLEIYATRVVGRVIRYMCCTQANRAILLKILTNVALSSKWNKNKTEEFDEEENYGKDMSNDVPPTDLSESVQLSAIRELEYSLIAPFDDSPLLHYIVPTVIEYLCKILERYASTFISNKGGGNVEDHMSNNGNQYEKILLCFATSLALFRLRKCSNESKVLLIERTNGLKFLPEMVRSVLFSNIDFETTFQDDKGIKSSPFICVDSYHPHNQSVESNASVQESKTIIRFDPIVHTMMTTYGHTRTARSSSRSGQLDELLSNLATICLCTIRYRIMSGWPILQTGGILDSFISITSVEASSESEREIEAKSRLLATLWENIIGLVVASSNENNDDDTFFASGKEEATSITDYRQDNELKGVAAKTFRLMTDYCLSRNNHAQSMISLRTIITSLPVLAKSHSRVGTESTCAVLFSVITKKLANEIENLRNDSSTTTNDITTSTLTTTTTTTTTTIQQVATLVTVLHEMVTMREDTGLSSDDLLSCFRLCLQVTRILINRQPTYCQNVTLRCLVSTIENMSKDAIMEVESFIYNNFEEYFGKLNDDKNDNTAVGMDAIGNRFQLGNDFVWTLLHEVVYESSSKYEKKYSDEGAEQHKNDISSNNHNHEELATEFDNIENFKVETMDKNGSTTPVMATWLCGQSMLLTIRVGSSQSRCRGWIELTVRSSTNRKRHMVRLLSKISIRNPHNPSTLWSSSQSSSSSSSQRVANDKEKSSDELLKTENDEIKSLSSPSMDYMSNTDSILEQYKALIDRFDSLIPPSSPPPTTTTTTTTTTTSTTPTTRTSTKTKKGNADVESLTKYSDHSKQNKSRDGMKIATSSKNDDITTSISGDDDDDDEDDGRDKGSILSWLKFVLDSEDTVKDVTIALKKHFHINDNILKGTTKGTDNDNNSDNDNNMSRQQRQQQIMHSVRRLSNGPKLDRAISVLDRTVPSNTHKIAILYAGPQRWSSPTNNVPETFLLSVNHCSPSFHTFVNGLGHLVPTKHLRYFSAGLDVSEKYASDGRYARVWVGTCTHGHHSHEDKTNSSSSSSSSSSAISKTIVVYHTVHLMPLVINGRKRHVGNDNVHIIYLDIDTPVGADIELSSEDGYSSSIGDGTENDNENDDNGIFTTPLVSGHFGFVTIFVSVSEIAMTNGRQQQDEKQQEQERQKEQSIKRKTKMNRKKKFVTRVTVRIRKGLSDALYQELLPFAGTDVLFDNQDNNSVEEDEGFNASASCYVRNLAIRADLACRSVLDNLAPASNCHERYRMLLEMERHVTTNAV